MHIEKIITLATGLLFSLSAAAHGPHAAVQGSGLIETLTHLAAHSWPVLPIAALAIWFYRKQQSEG